MRTMFFASTLLAFTVAGTARAGGTIGGQVEATPAKYLQDTVVYLKDAPAEHAPQNVLMDQRGLRFVPHIVTITEGDTVTFKNSDEIAHNVYSPDGERYDLGLFMHRHDASHTYNKRGVYAQLCAIHPEMIAYVFVGQNPYASTVDAEGRYQIDGVPPGTYQLAVWNGSKLRSVEKTVTVVAGRVSEVNLSIER
jgi:plastocyanin